MNIRKSLSAKIFVLMLMAISICALLIGQLSYMRQKGLIKSMLGRELVHIATTAAGLINGDTYEKLLTRSDTFSDEYKKIQRLLYRIKVLNKLDMPIYTMRRSGRNEVEFVVTSDEVRWLGTKYKLKKEMLPAFKKGASTHTDIYTDKNGTWISAYAPIKNRANEVVSILEVDYRVEKYLHELHKNLFLIILTCIAGFAASLILSLPWLASITGSIRALNDAASKLEKGNYNVSIKVKNEDEIGNLANAMERMRISLKKNMGQLEEALLKEKEAHFESVIALSKVLELKDPDMRGHIDRVVQYAVLMGEELALSEEEVEVLRYGCLLHDVGKLGLEATLIKKSTKLTDEEYETIRKHPQLGANIVKGIKFLEKANDAILYHQEHYDGKGYPKGLKGEEIPITARIVALADAFDAMTTDRPYRPKMDIEKAFKTIEKEKGKHFDPKVVDVFLKLKKSIIRIRKGRA